MIRDRIKELRRVRAATLRPNPRNWRTHPEHQRQALRAVLDEIGYADALVARELEDGTLELVDGHLRAETTPDEIVPVLIVDVSEQEAGVLLATLDPLAAMAEPDQRQLQALLEEHSLPDAYLRATLEKLAGVGDLPLVPDDSSQSAVSLVPELYQIVVECAGETEQQELFERLVSEGFKCKALVL